MGDNIEQKSTEIKTEKKKPGPKPKTAKEAETVTQAAETAKAVDVTTEEQLKVDDIELGDSQDTIEKTEEVEEYSEVEPLNAESTTVVEDVLEEFDLTDVPDIRTFPTNIRYSSVVPFVFYRGPHDSLGDGYATDVLLTGEVADGFAKCELLAPNWISAIGYVKVTDEIRHLLEI